MGNNGLVLGNLRNDLEIQIEMKDINYAYRSKKTKDINTTSPILVNFVSIAKEKKYQRMSGFFKRIPIHIQVFITMKDFWKFFFKARTLLRLNKIVSNWTSKEKSIFVKIEPQNQ